MAIKNFSVKTKQIKKGQAGLSRQLRYLHDQAAPSHKRTIIHELLSGSKLGEAYQARRIKRQSEGLRGGGVRNHATSFIIALPSDLKHPSTHEWREILKDILKGIAKVNNLNARELAQHCEAVLHDESRSGKNSHIHLVVSNIINTDHIKSITQRKTTYAVKTSFTNAVKRVLGFDHLKYKTKKQRDEEKRLEKIRKTAEENERQKSKTALKIKNAEAIQPPRKRRRRKRT